MRKLLRSDQAGALPQIVRCCVGALGEKLPRCSKRTAVTILHNRIGADELPARAEEIAAILHLLLPPAIVNRLVSKKRLSPRCGEIVIVSLVRLYLWKFIRRLPEPRWRVDALELQ